MKEATNKNSPWKNFPENIVRFANQFENTDNEFERLIGYLLLDVGVENLLKTYVLDSNLKYGKKEASTKGIVKKDFIHDSINTANFEKITFHNLVEAAREASEAKVTDDELKNVEHFHGIRNVIYHEGRKTFPSKQDFYEYLSLAKSFLQKLLGIEWESQEKNELNKKEYYKELEYKVAIATEIFRPEFATRIFEEKLKIIGRLYDEENVRESEERVITGFNRFVRKLTGREIHDFSFIKKCMDDITFLRLDAIRTEVGLEQNDIEQWLEYKKWATSPIKPIEEEFTPEDVQRVKNLNI